MFASECNQSVCVCGVGVYASGCGQSVCLCDSDSYQMKLMSYACTCIFGYNFFTVYYYHRL